MQITWKCDTKGHVTIEFDGGELVKACAYMFGKEALVINEVAVVCSVMRHLVGKKGTSLLGATLLEAVQDKVREGDYLGLAPVIDEDIAKRLDVVLHGGHWRDQESA